MSKLVELLNHDMLKIAVEKDPSLIASEPYARGFVDALNAALTVLPYHDAEIREQAKREQMEADLSAIGNVRGRHWRDLSDGFQFAEEAIRAAWAKAHPKENE